MADTVKLASELAEMLWEAEGCDLDNIAVQRMTLRERLRDEYRNCRGVRRMSVTTAAYWSWRLARADTPEQWLDIHTRCSGEQS